VRGERRPILAVLQRERDCDGRCDRKGEKARQQQLEPRREPQAERIRGQDGAEHRERDSRGDASAGGGEVRDVVAADQRDRRRAEQDGREEPAAGDCPGAVAET
jgi:hypothetical protein